MNNENSNIFKYDLTNLMKYLIEKQTGKRISKSTPRADLIKYLLMQEFGLSEEAIISSNCLDQNPKVIYGHLTTLYTIRFNGNLVDIITAEDDSGFLMMRSKLLTTKNSANPNNSIYPQLPSEDIFAPLVKFFDKIMGRKKLIDFLFIPEEYQKYYNRGEPFVYSENHLWEGDAETAHQIVKDLYTNRFNSTVKGPFFEARYNNDYGSTKIKLWTWDQMHKLAYCK